MAGKKKKSPQSQNGVTAESLSQQASVNNMTLALSQTTLSDKLPKPAAAPAIPRLTKKNIVQEFDRYFGNVSNLENWQHLCRDVGINEEFRSVTQCRKALKGVWVNIYDLLEAVRDKICPPPRFPTQKALSAYTIKHRKFYPKRKAKAEGPIRDLLAHIF